ncbi:methyltransferase domain-containing protein [Hydrogenophaga sp.]|uniref:methyltransferase domain-containing protein n=1 Tax=Hydrogenophaga sp. TaxID=1904254 RepID=UPI002731A585|nr:methyltransferase domain-containing protein [Hydrogenophaga sp.]MDP2073516.1 methyltransferase domain-containing protein [Hydrogenophaga sp.]MDP3109428.1 methyltransferase domain-containing protein [Hydrogenophaga sp.]
MHPSALKNGESFFQCYGKNLGQAASVRVIDIGAQDVNGSLRQVCPPAFEYLGVDFVAGKGVDVVLEDPYVLPFDDASVDVAVSSSCFEHSEMFWVLFLEVLRTLKPHGLLYLNAPSNGSFHRYPVDCWRFFPDSGKALVKWAHRQGMQPALLEWFVSQQLVNPWSDFVAVFAKDVNFQQRYPDRMASARTDIENVHLFGQNDVQRFTAQTEDLRRMAAMASKLNKILSILNT